MSEEQLNDLTVKINNIKIENLDMDQPSNPAVPATTASLAVTVSTASPPLTVSTSTSSPATPSPATPSPATPSTTQSPIRRALPSSSRGSRLPSSLVYGDGNEARGGSNTQDTKRNDVCGGNEAQAGPSTEDTKLVVVEEQPGNNIGNRRVTPPNIYQPPNLLSPMAVTPDQLQQVTLASGISPDEDLRHIFGDFDPVSGALVFDQGRFNQQIAGNNIEPLPVSGNNLEPLPVSGNNLAPLPVAGNNLAPLPPVPVAGNNIAAPAPIVGNNIAAPAAIETENTAKGNKKLKPRGRPKGSTSKTKTTEIDAKGKKEDGQSSSGASNPSVPAALASQPNLMEEIKALIASTFSQGRHGHVVKKDSHGGGRRRNGGGYGGRHGGGQGGNGHGGKAKRHGFGGGGQGFSNFRNVRPFNPNPLPPQTHNPDTPKTTQSSDATTGNLNNNIAAPLPITENSNNIAAPLPITENNNNIAAKTSPPAVEPAPQRAQVAPFPNAWGREGQGVVFYREAAQPTGANSSAEKSGGGATPMDGARGGKRTESQQNAGGGKKFRPAKPQNRMTTPPVTHRGSEIVPIQLICGRFFEDPLKEYTALRNQYQVRFPVDVIASTGLQNHTVFIVKKINAEEAEAYLRQFEGAMWDGAAVYADYYQDEFPYQLPEVTKFTDGRRRS